MKNPQEEHRPLCHDTTDICQQLMERYAKSSATQHRHLLATAAAMRSILAAESLPLSPSAYLAAGISSADSALNSPTMDPTAVSALLTFLSLVVPLVPPRGIASEKAGEAMTVIVRLIEREGEKLGVASLRGGVKFLGLLLVGFCDLDDWKSLQLGFDSLLKFCIDKRPKVRRCAQECLEKVFRSFKSSTVIMEASKSVNSLLKEYIPVIANLSTTRIDEGTKVDLTSKPESVEGVHLLNLLGISIPFLSDKVSSRLLSELCRFMTYEFSVVTRQIFQAIEVFFETSKDEIIIPETERIITSLAGYVSLQDKNPVDTIMHASTLLKSALKKLHSAEPRSCIRKLPMVFGSLAGLLTSMEGGNAAQASVVLKDLVNCHIDKRFLLIDGSQSFEDEITDSEETSALKSVCAIFEGNLDSTDAIPDEHTVAVISLLFLRLGELSYVFMKTIVLKLANLIPRASADASSTNLLQHCIGSAVTAMGPEKILKLIPISFDAEELTFSNSWLVPILKKYIVGASLGYYVEHVVPLAKSSQRASRKVKKPALGQDMQAHAHAHAHGLLRLLPAFCHYPVDTHQKFGSLAELLVTFLNKNSFLHETIALSLQVLVNQNKSMLRSKKDVGEAETYAIEDSIPEIESATRYTKKAATENIKALASGSSELLQALVDIFVDSIPGTCPYLKDSIGCLASITDSSITEKIFMSLLEKFKCINGEGEIEGQRNQNEESIDEEKENSSTTETQLKRCAVMDLASAFVEGAKEDLVVLIFNVICQTFQATEEIGHNESYYALSRILEEHTSFCSSRYVELIDMLLGLKSPDYVGSLRSRFACFHILMVHAFQMSSEEENEKAFFILNEVILTLKDGKEERRKAAYDVLVMIYTSLKNSSRATSDELCSKLITMIMGYLSSSSPQIKSGAVSALSVLVYKEPGICLSIPDLVSSLLSLLQTKAVEVVKAVLGFVKVVVSSLQSNDLQNLLADLVTGILPWSSVSRHHFRSKVTVILEILRRKCGSGAVQSITPEKYKGFVKAVLENRWMKSNSKEETTDLEMAPADCPKESHKRKHKALDSIPVENGTVEQKKSKRHKKTYSNPQGGSIKPFASTNGGGGGGGNGMKPSKNSSRRFNHENPTKGGSSNGSWKKGKKDFKKSPMMNNDKKTKTEKLRRTKDTAASDSKSGKRNKFGKK